MSEPTLASIATQIDRGFAHDDRLRAVEQQVAALRLLPSEMRRMEDRLVTEIRDLKSSEDQTRRNWPTVAATLVAGVALVLTIAQALYGG